MDIMGIPSKDYTMEKRHMALATQVIVVADGG
jgi:hypothetical protein